VDKTGTQALNDIAVWLGDHDVEYVECLIVDFAGIARGKIQPISELGDKPVRLPIALFGQTVTANYHLRRDNARDRDMECAPDPATLRLTPWASRPTASVLLDCSDERGRPVDVDPRVVLKRVLSFYEARGWYPIVAPEVEFYLLPAMENPSAAEVPEKAPENTGTEMSEPYGVDRIHEHSGLFDALNGHCAALDIGLGAVSQELGPGQFEVNFHHGEALRLADNVLHFKRALKHEAVKAGLQASFLAKRSPDQPGSALHVHQSVYDAAGNNVFSLADGSASTLFGAHIAGLQTYMRDALLLFAPYANSYRRFLSHWASPVNLEWGTDNRTAGLRVPGAPPEARRVENRIAGSDVNPYLAIAGSLACGYLGMVNELEPRPAVNDSAYDTPFALHRHFYEALDALRESEAMAEMLGEDFVRVYCATKEREFRDLEERIPPWERDELGRII
jgi:glutamine synthetase